MIKKIEERLMVTKLKRGNKLKKKGGNEALVITLILISIGVVLAFIYRDSVTSMIQSFITNVTGKLSTLLNIK